MSSWLQPYGILQAIAIVTGILLVDRNVRKQGDCLLEHPGLLLAALVSSGVCGRLHVLAEALIVHGATWSEIAPRIHPLTGGSAFYGAIGGVVLILLFWPLRLPTGSRATLFDTAIVGLAVAIFIGRLGCLCQGCCHGYPTDGDSGIFSTLSSLGPQWQQLWAFHPLPLWLGLWALFSATIISRLRKYFLPGNAFVAFAGLFSLGRFPLEFMRWQPPGSPGISMAQWEALSLVLITLGLLLVRQQAFRFPGRKQTAGFN